MIAECSAERFDLFDSQVELLCFKELMNEVHGGGVWYRMVGDELWVSLQVRWGQWRGEVAVYEVGECLCVICMHVWVRICSRVCIVCDMRAYVGEDMFTCMYCV